MVPCGGGRTVGTTTLGSGDTAVILGAPGDSVSPADGGFFPSVAGVASVGTTAVGVGDRAVGEFSGLNTTGVGTGDKAVDDAIVGVFGVGAGDRAVGATGSGTGDKAVDGAIVGVSGVVAGDRAVDDVIGAFFAAPERVPSIREVVDIVTNAAVG